MSAVVDRERWSTETDYAGVKFRSRLEARWAVFFDALGLRWEYEPETFATPHGRYAPDFLIESVPILVEVKPRELNENELLRAEWVADHTSMRVAVLGNLPTRENVGDYPASPEWNVVNPYDVGFWWCICPECGAVGYEFEGRSARLKCRKTTCPTDSDREHTHSDARLMSAYERARKMRFWETPR